MQTGFKKKNNLKNQKAGNDNSLPAYLLDSIPRYLDEKTLYSSKLLCNPTIFIAVYAASSPLFPCFPPARSSACC